MDIHLKSQTMISIWSRIKQILTSEYLSLLLRFLVGYYFIYASMDKIPNPAQFAVVIENYRTFPYWAIKISAVIVPWTELFCGLFLIIGLKTRAAAAIIILLFLVFNVIIGANAIIGASFSCGCYDTVGDPIGWKKVGKNFIWMLLAVQVFFFDRLFLLRGGRMFRKQGVS